MHVNYLTIDATKIRRIDRALNRFSTSQFLRAKGIFSFVSASLVPLGFNRKLKDKGKSQIFVSVKSALG